MLLSDIAVKRPTLAIVANALLLVFGILAFTNLPLRQYPDVDPPIVGIDVTYRGASAEIVDTKVTRLLEDQLSGIEAIRYIDSVSSDGAARITIEFEIERDVEAAVNDVQQAIGRVMPQLPAEIDAPRVRKADANANPIMWFNLTSDRLNELELSDYARRVIVDRLSVVDGVALVIVGGEREYAMRLYLDRRKLAARQLTVTDVEDALRAENVELPAGRIQSDWRNFSARISRIYQSPEDFARLVIKRGDDGHLVRLGEVADISLAAADDENLFRRDGVSMIGLGIVKQSQANTVEVAERARAEVARINPLLPEGMTIERSGDTSVFIAAAIEEVYTTLAIAMVMVVLVIYLFLGNVRATLIPAITVPISLVASFIFVAMMGFSINILTLLALVLAIGLVVDDSIVMLENIYSRIEQGEPPMLAAYRGARQVGFAIVATTLVLIAVFLPLMFLEGNIGRLFTEFALTIAAAVGISSFVALTLSPVLCSLLLKNRPAASHGFIDGPMAAMEKGYNRALRAEGKSLTFLLSVLGVAVVATILLLERLPGEFAPEEDSGQMMMMYRGPEGANFQQTRKTMLEIEEAVLANFDALSLERFQLRVPSFGGSGSVNTGMAFIGFVPWEQREQSAMALRGQFYGLLSGIADGRIFILNPSGLSPRGLGQPVQVAIGGDTYEELAEWRGRILDYFQDHPVLRNVDIDFAVNAQQVAVKVDQQRAADLGVSVATVGRTLETMLGSRVVTTYLERGEEYDVILEGMETDFRSPEDLKQIYVRSDRSGELVPLASVVQVAEQGVSPNLPRYNRRRALTLSADIAPGHAMDAAIEAVRTMVREELPSTASIDYKGQSLEYIRASGSMLFVFLLAIAVAYLVMAAQFESFLHPLLILMTVPLATAGALLGLYLTGQTLNIFSQIGLVMLIGLAAKNGILIIEFANQLRDQGLPFDQALYNAALQRLRPILMTSLTTVVGAVPLLLAFGAGAEARFVLGVVIFFGVLVATLLTLFVLPAAYLLLARNSNTPGRVARKIRALEEGE